MDNYIELKKRIKFGGTTTAFLFPALLIYIALVVVPGFMSLYYSFTDWNGVHPTFNFIGFENFIRLFNDSHFLISIKNNFIYLFFNGAIQNTMALLYAIILNEGMKANKVYRAIIYLPFVLTPVGIGITFSYLFHPLYGIFRRVSDFTGLEFLNLNLLASPKLVVFAIASVQIWLTMGVMVMVWLAGLQTLNRTFIEAAEIDGANSFHILTKVIIPLLTPSIIIVTVLTIVGNFKAFDLPMAMTNGGPGYSSYFVAMIIYKEAFSYYNFGYAMAASSVIFIIPLILVIIAILFMRKRLNY